MSQPMHAETNQLLNAKEEKLAELLDQYLTSLETGSPLDLEALAQEHPEIEEELISFTKSLQELHHIAQQFNEDQPLSVGQKPAKSLGDFEIGAEIGRGGMGVVYEARQISLDRKVALKVLPFAAMWDDKQIARFRNEAQAAAQLNHQNIVPVFAVGQDRGLHFYAMQYIAGQPLDRVLHDWREQSEHELANNSTHIQNSTLHSTPLPNGELQLRNQSTTVRSSQGDSFDQVAKLGIQAAKALHYAHECGVVHRDIKPSNLILDGSGKLWVTDFGLARVQDNPGITMTGDVLGTLRYMSPEQASGQHALMDHRVDVYSLGATLYEMLALRAAFPGDDYRKLQQQIELSEPAGLRSINPAIPQDLETIILVSMSKSREARYDTAQEMAEDLERFMAGKPIHARRPTIVDRGAKWVKRHRLVTIAAAASLLIFAVASAFGAFLLARETAKKEAALNAAQQNLEQAWSIVDRFGSHFSKELENLPGSETLQRELLQDTLHYYKNFLSNAENDLGLQEEVATTSFKAARIAKRLGRYEEARTLFNNSLEIFQQMDPSTENAARLLQRRALCLNEMGLLEASLGNIAVAKQNCKQAIELQEESCSDDFRDLETTQTLAEMLLNQALLERHSGDLVQAKYVTQKAISFLEDLTQEYPHDQRIAHDLAIALNNRSFVEQDSDWVAARDSCRAAIDILLELTSAEVSLQPDTMRSSELDRLSDLALFYNNLGSIQSHLGEHDLACDLYRKGIEIQEKLREQSPAVIRYRSDLAVSWNNLGQALTQLREKEAANSAFVKARSLAEHLSADYPGAVRFQNSLAGILNNQAMALEHVGDAESAAQLYEKAIEHQQAILEKSVSVGPYRENLSKHYINYGRVLRKLNRPMDAAQVSKKLRELWPADGMKLLQVAHELSQSADLLQQASSTSPQYDELRQEIIATLQQAKLAISHPVVQTMDVNNFPCLQDYPQAAAVFADRD